MSGIFVHSKVHICKSIMITVLSDARTSARIPFIPYITINVTHFQKALTPLPIEDPFRSCNKCDRFNIPIIVHHFNLYS